MTNTQISALLKKADELRALFILGQKVIPFMEEVFVFVSEIQPLLDEINNSISENIKKMPNASKQLTKVTEATELATTEILDLVDGIFFNLDTVVAELNVIKSNNNSSYQGIANSLEELYNNIDVQNNNTFTKAKLKEIIDTISKQDNNDERYNKITEIIHTIQADSSSIMISLQVQDITSQQLAAVNKLLETLQVKLESILGHFKDSDLSHLTTTTHNPELSYGISQVSKLHRNIAFDPNAVDSIINRDVRQNEIDEFIKNSTIQNAIDDNESTNQDDIDKLFSEQNSSDDMGENFENIDTIEENSLDEGSFEAFSQDDIDKLFKKNG